MTYKDKNKERAWRRKWEKSEKRRAYQREYKRKYMKRWRQEWIKKNPNKFKEYERRRNIRNKIRKQERKKKLVEYKGGRCERCGYNKCLGALGFHHKDSSKKEFTISEKLSCNFNKLKKEVDKCTLLCANCHAELMELQNTK